MEFSNKRAAFGFTLALALAAGETLLVAQEFDAASVKPAAAGQKKGRIQGGPGTADPGRFTITNYPLKRLIMRAWGVEDYQMQTPDWMATEKYDITATLPPGATAADGNAMLRNLLIGRFQMKLHHADTKMPVLYLLPGPTGNKMKPSPESPQVFGVPPKLGPKGQDGFPQLDDAYVRSLGAATVVVGGRAKTVALGETMDRFVQHLTVHLGHPVFNKTGLSGAYDFTLLWTPTDGPDVEDVSPNTVGPAGGPRIAAAVAKQLGLRLEKRTESVDVLVVDHAEKNPTGN